MVLEGCGITKGCFRYPEDCQGRNCQYIVSYVARLEYIDFEVSVSVPDDLGEDIYAAIGFNTVREMVRSSSAASLKADSCPDTNFIIIGDKTGCRYDNLRCHQWRKSWHYDDSQFSIDNLSGLISCRLPVIIRGSMKCKYEFQSSSFFRRRVDIVSDWSRSETITENHICVRKAAIFGSDNGLTPTRRQAIIWTNAKIFSVNWTLRNKLHSNVNRNSNSLT